MSTPIAHPYSADFLAALRGCTLDAAGTLLDASGTAVRPYVDASQRWGLTYDMGEGASIDAPTLRTMTGAHAPPGLAFCLGTDAGGRLVASVRSIEPDGGPPDPTFAG